MKTKYLVFMMGTLLMLGLITPVSAGWETDATGDTANNGTVGDYDIVKGMVGLYPDGAGLEEYASICVQMTQSMPGNFMVSFDLDNDSGTGSPVSMVDTFKTCEGGTFLRTAPNRPQGIDMVLYIMLRDQVDDASTSWGYQCIGSPGGVMCMERSAACSGCDQGDCYTGGDLCSPDDPDCYVMGDLCTTGGGSGNCTEGEDICSVMNTACTSTESCAVGRRQGEWLANPMGGGESVRDPADRGRIDMPLPPGPGEDDSFCFKLPWKRMVENVAAASTASPSINFTAAENPANVKWEISTWYNTVAPDDLIGTSPAPCTCVTDVLPDSSTLLDTQASDGDLCHQYQEKLSYCMAKKADGNNLDYSECQGYEDQSPCESAGCFWSGGYCNVDACLSDTNFDGKVTLYDIAILKREYNRMDCSSP